MCHLTITAQMLWNVPYKCGKITSLQDLPASPKCSLTYWCYLIEEANITLNSLWHNGTNPLILTFKFIHGPFNFQATPMPSPGTKCLVHIKLNHWQTRAVHAEPAFYIRPLLYHYQCHKLVMKQLGTERIAYTLSFQHHFLLMNLSTTNCLVIAIKHLQDIITNHPLPYTVEEQQAIKWLHDLFKQQKGFTSVINVTPIQPTTQTQETIGKQQMPTLAIPNATQTQQCPKPTLNIIYRMKQNQTTHLI